MYVAKTSREERLPVLVDAVRDIQFGALVTALDNGFAASHLPMMLREAADGSYVLEGHVSRANDLWKAALARPRTLAIFQGPQAYIHPGWYPTKHRDGRAVPTWNYIAIHLQGELEPMEDEAWLRRHLVELTERNEASQAEPWEIADAPADYIAAMVGAIVGLRMPVLTFEGNWKMAQKRPVEDRLGAMQGLASSKRPGDRDVAEVMRRLNGG